MKILVTGASGFVGKKLVRALAERQHEVIAGLHRTDVSFDSPMICCNINMLDTDTVIKALQKFKPEGIIHLAGQTHVTSSWSNPAHTIQTNVMGVIHLLHAVKRAVPEAKVITVGSSEEYGLSGKQGVPLTEDSPCSPQNPYAVSKYAAGQIALQIAKREQLRLIHARPFNHFGPGQKTGFVVSDFISQIVEMEQGVVPPVLSVGDISVQRDFLYIDDVIHAYIGLLEQDVPNGIYNVASGKCLRIEELLIYLASQTKVKFEVKRDESKYRPSNVPFIVGCAEKIQSVTDWKPQIPVFNGLKQTLDWWREKY